MRHLIEVRRDLHKIPEVGFNEFKTQSYLLQFISNLDQQHLQITTWKTGIVVFIKGTNPSKLIGWRADIDALPVQKRRDCRSNRSMPVLCMLAVMIAICRLHLDLSRHFPSSRQFKMSLFISSLLRKVQAGQSQCSNG